MSSELRNNFALFLVYLVLEGARLLILKPYMVLERLPIGRSAMAGVTEKKSAE